MRTTLLGQSRETLDRIRTAADRVNRATQQVSSGLRVVRPSDSPAGAGGVVRARSELVRIGQHRDNLESAQAELRAVDGFLSDAVDALQRALTLGVQGATGTQTAQTRETIREEVEGLLRHLVSIGNSVHGGRRVFAGAAQSGPAFELDEATSAARYRGGAQGRSLTFPDGRSGAISLPGDAIFATPEQAVGQGRTPQTTGAPPSPPIGIGVSFSGDVEGSVSVDLPGFFVAAAAPAGAAPGDVVSVSFVSSDGSVAETIATPALAGGESAAALAGLLNAEIAQNPALGGLVSFADEGGALKIAVSDTAGVSFDFSSVSSGAVVSGLEGGGAVGGFSAEEIAEALNAEVAQDAGLSGAGIVFTARDGEVVLDSDIDVTATVVDFSRGSEFRSGLSGVHRIGGADSADAFGALTALSNALAADDEDAIEAAVADLQRAVDHVSRSQGFYGATLNRVNVTLDNLDRLEVINRERLSNHQDVDIVEAISELQAASTAEELAIQVAGRQRPNLLDVIG